jgi:thioredoxin reductase (NADPH)
MEDALFLTRFNNQITIIQLGDKLTASQIMQDRVLSKPEIKIIYNSQVQAILGNGAHVTGIQVQNLETSNLQEIPASAVFIAIGLKPMSDLFAGQLAIDNYGHILVTKQTHSSIPGVFIAGDVCDSKYRQAITAAGFGCMAALDAERYLAK